MMQGLHVNGIDMLFSRTPGRQSVWRAELHAGVVALSQAPRVAKWLSDAAYVVHQMS